MVIGVTGGSFAGRKKINKKMNKKAVFFTFIAVLLLAILVFSFSIHSRYSRRTRALVIETRVHFDALFLLWNARYHCSLVWTSLPPLSKCVPGRFVVHLMYVVITHNY